MRGSQDFLQSLSLSAHPGLPPPTHRIVVNCTQQMSRSASSTRAPRRGRALYLTLTFIILFILYQNARLLIHNLTVPSHFSTVDWPPSEVNACLETSCFLKPPFSTQIPESEALESLNLMEQYLNAHFVQTIHQVSGQRLPFRECSVVGGSPRLPNMTHDAFVDSTIVFRLNMRAPEFLKAESILTGLGTRTDFLVVQHITVRKIQRYIEGRNINNKTLQKARADAGARFRDRRPILLYRTECSRAKACPRAWARLIDSEVPGWLPVSFVNPHHEFETMRQLNRERTGVYRLPRKLAPTTGLVAIFIALSNCRHVNLFGFNGSPVGDGDFVNKTVGQMHPMTSERNVVRWLSQCPHEESWLCGRLTIYS